MGGTSRAARLLLAACVAVTGAVTGAAVAGADQEIVGGTRASIADHSYMVFLASPDGFQFCGGTLVDDNKVLTAAHCLTDKEPADLVVVAGREDKDSDAGVVAPVRAIWTHPDYQNVRSGSDVAVLTLGQRLPYENLPVAGAEDTDAYQAGQPGLVLGWGRTAMDGPSSRFLLKATVPLVADADCTTSYSAYQPASMVCAGVPEGGVDSCQGDSGGPLIVGSRLVGITSWGEGCAMAGKPGVYTRVAAYADVLQDQI